MLCRRNSTTALLAPKLCANASLDGSVGYALRYVTGWMQATTANRHANAIVRTQASAKTRRISARVGPRLAPGADASRALAAAIAVGGVVVVQEDLLQRWLTAGEGGDGVLGEHGEQRSDLACDLEPERARAGACHLDCRQ